MQKEKINFVKAVASGNDFVIIKVLGYLTSPRFRRAGVPRLNYKKIAKQFCERKFGIGADGLLVIEPSQKADFRMRIFNPDGSEAEMCGNGARCVALWVTSHQSPVTSHQFKTKKIEIETKAGIIEAEIKKVTSHTLAGTGKSYPCGYRQVISKKIKIKMPQPKNFKADISLKIDKKTISVNFVKVGVPHAVVFVKNLEKIDVANLGRKIREHQKFQPQGTNVNFVQILDKDSIRIRTYERGVKQETLSCGTGSAASSVIAYRLSFIGENKINVHTQGEILKVYFDRQLKDIYLEGKAKIVYAGKYES